MASSMLSPRRPDWRERRWQIITIILIILSASKHVFQYILHQEERKRKFEAELDFAPEDIALATVPGLDFDPKTRTFQMEELRPQPIIKKRKKKAVPEAMKDERYWEKREKNKEATRRSREAKRLKENQIVLRAAYLEKENKVLKQVNIRDSRQSVAEF